jgi:mRNA interferase YafQ
MGKYSIVPSTRFKKDPKKYQNQPKEYQTIFEVVDKLAENGHVNIPFEMKPHRLKGGYHGYWESHLFPDLLLIWGESESPAEIYLVRVGSYADLF